MHMALHLLVFVVGEPRPLANEVAGNRQLADVMNERGPAQLLEPGAVEAHFLADHLGEVGHPLGVAPRVEVFGFEGLDEAPQRRELGLSHPSEGLEGHMADEEDDERSGAGWPGPP